MELERREMLALMHGGVAREMQDAFAPRGHRTPAHWATPQSAAFKNEVSRPVVTCDSDPEAVWVRR